ncbi:hypothetical protein [Cesiribacter sp. SM1]|uniref:hypothetical protein n=1 Tax=Cesiribacter sp. SM1 TaxID=2861196 RepID=UPI001CD4C7A3|nr:hypothetical protein [Cesiribacter sp. SM1]
MTAKQAVNRGHLVISLPTIILLIGGIVGLYYLLENIIHPGLFLFGCFVLVPLISWIYYHFAIRKWLIWALSEVEDHAELKFYAVTSGLVLSEYSFHISNSKEAKLLKKLENDYLIRQQKKVFEDDQSVPEVEEIAYSRAYLVIKVVAACIFFVLGLYLFFSLMNWVAGLMSIIAAAMLGYKCIDKLSSKEIPLKIGNFGIEVHGDRFEWRQIRNERAVAEGTGKRRRNYLVFKGKSKPMKIDINDFDVALDDLRKKLIFHRARYNNTNANNRIKQGL